jgi:hypothetical protein
MKRKTRADKPLELLRGALFVSALVGLLVPTLHAQEIRIKVLNAHNGKPVTDECVNVSLGTWHGGDLIAPTNKEGFVVLHFKNGQVTAAATIPRACNGMEVLGPKRVPTNTTTIAITSDKYVDCQEWAKVVPGEALKDVLNRAPSYPIRNILESGMTAGNRCGRFRAKGKPGELIFFVRPRGFWEKMRE